MAENKELGVYEYDRSGVSERMSEELFSSVFQAVGTASMCWSNINGAGTFNTKEAGEIAFELCHIIADEIKAERNAACGYIESTITRRARREAL
jgi:hypothetical protein